MLAFRDSILNLFCGLVVQTDNGQAIVNELGRLDFINNLRLKIENSIDWMQTIGSLLHFSLDTVATSYYQGSAGAFVGSAPVPFGPGNQQAGFANNNVNPFLPDTCFGGANGGHYGTAPTAVNTTSASTLSSNTWSTRVTYDPTLTNGTITIASTGVVLGNQTDFTPDMVGGTITVTGGTPYSGVIIGYTNATTLQVNTGAPPLGPVGTFTISYNANTNQPPVAVPNPGFNQGLMNRIQFFQNASSYNPGAPNSTGGSFSMVAKIPLTLLHDFFTQLDFPVINLGFNIQLIFRQPNNMGGATNSQFVQPYGGIGPLQAGSMYATNGTTPYAIWTTACPAIQYGGSTTATNTYGNTCRLYYRSLKLNPTENEAFKTKLMRGFTKKIKFISTDTFQMNGAIFQTTNNSFVISPAIVWPLRVWAMLYTNGTTNSAVSQAQSGSLCGAYISNPSTGGTQPSQAAQCGLQVCHGWMTNANIQVNNQPYFKVPLSTPDDFWLQFKDQLNRNTGCMISYQDFISKFRYHCFDLSRLSDRLPSKTESVSLVLNFDRADNWAGACDLVVMIERLNQVQMDFAASDVTITVGNITN